MGQRPLGCQGQPLPQPLPPPIVALAHALPRGKTVAAALVVKMQALHATQTWLIFVGSFNGSFTSPRQSHRVELSKVWPCAIWDELKHLKDLKATRPSFLWG